MTKTLDKLTRGIATAHILCEIVEVVDTQLRLLADDLEDDPELKAVAKVADLIWHSNGDVRNLLGELFRDIEKKMEDLS